MKDHKVLSKGSPALQFANPNRKTFADGTRRLALRQSRDKKLKLKKEGKDKVSKDAKLIIGAPYNLEHKS